jgi:hypothetical protein
MEMRRRLTGAMWPKLSKIAARDPLKIESMLLGS